MIERLLLGLLAMLAVSPALACSCERIAPAAFRASAELIVEGEVVALRATPQNRPGMNRATIRVVRAERGASSRFVVIWSRNQPEACGLMMRQGERREFLARRMEGRWRTDACLMLGAKRPAR
jgi:hypothetical protein